MKMWNKQIAQAVLCLGVLSLTPSIASAYDSCYDPCDPCEDFCAFGGFEIGADFLYWKPCVDDLSVVGIANTADDVTTVSYKDICPEWEPGFRIRLAKSNICGCISLSGSYTWLKTDDEDSYTSESGVLHPVLLHNALIDANVYNQIAAAWNTTYQSFDVLLSYDLNCNDCQTLTPFFGVEGLILNQSLDHAYSMTAVTQTSVWDCDFFGAGFKMGLQHDVAFSDCFSFFAKGSGTIVAGSNDGKVTFVDVDGASYVFEDDSTCIIVPGYHLQAGLKYESDWCGMDFAFRLGYEMLEWRNIPNPRRFYGDSTDFEVAVSTSPTVTTFGFHGLFAGLDFQF